MTFIEPKEACKRALASNEIAHQQGIANPDARVQEQRLATVRKALSVNDTVFDTMPIAKLLGRNAQALIRSAPKGRRWLNS